jgi:hypothetical protein
MQRGILARVCVLVFSTSAAEVHGWHRVTSFSSGEHFASFVEARVKEGRHDNASDVMRDDASGH